ncbi:SDR family oxidoreductase, partial [Candidatus Parcubacteria bacterium]|nr:SDR family oxidoreductase [Candidatus Parcubacteria bacterium]
MSILLTGNRGFIGSGIKADFGIDIKSGLDIVDYKNADRTKFDVVIHTAAKISVTESMENPEEYVRTNVMGTLNMLRQHPEAHFIYLSTAGIYGEGTDHTIASEAKPESIYALTKYLGEFVVRAMARSWTIFRLTNVIGDGERGEPNVYQVFQKADVLPIYGDGLQT